MPFLILFHPIRKNHCPTSIAPHPAASFGSSCLTSSFFLSSSSILSSSCFLNNLSCSSGCLPSSSPSPAIGFSASSAASLTISLGLLIGGLSVGFVLISSTLALPSWNQPPLSHSPGSYMHCLRMSLSMIAAISLLRRSNEMGFRIHASKPASMYC